jgi:hypothetical protein
MKTEEKERILTARDRCDQCIAQAWVIVKGINGQLYFCSHHFNLNEKMLKDWAKEIFDEREFLL